MSDNYAKDQAAAQYASIQAMLAAVDADYSRLEELGEELVIACEDNAFIQWVSDQSENPESVFHDAATEYLELVQEVGDNEDEESARQVIQDDPLSVEVRSGWTSLGEELKAEEFMILLCTGGPAVRIVGELSEHGEPERAWMEYQDWGTPWTKFFGAESDILVQYASHFYFGE